MTKEQLLALAHPDPGLEEHLAKSPTPLYNIDWNDATTTIKTLRAAAATKPPPPPAAGVISETHHMQTRDGFTLRLLAYRPSLPPAHPSPLVVLYHGGGFTVGDPEDLAAQAQRIVQTYAAVVVTPQYRLAPEHPFPYGVEDTWDSLKWIARNAAALLRASSEVGFVVGGVSAGAAAAVVLTHLARDEGLVPALTGVFLSCPSAVPVGCCPEGYGDRYLSRMQEECLNSPVLGRNMQAFFERCTKRDAGSKLHAAINWPTGHGGLPRAYFQVCGRDVLRDDGLIYEDVLRGEGVETRMDVYAGLPHCFWVMYPGLEAARRSVRDALEGVGWLLGMEAKGLP